MKYKITINDDPIGWVKHEETTDRSRLFELQKQAYENAIRCVKEIGKDAVRNRHFVYYYEIDEWSGIKKTGNVLVWVYMLPYDFDDEMFEQFVAESKPIMVGAIHGNNLCLTKFFEK